MDNHSVRNFALVPIPPGLNRDMFARSIVPGSPREGGGL